MLINVILLIFSFCNVKESPDGGLTSLSVYDPHLLDDPELTSGRHRKVLNLASYLVCIVYVHLFCGNKRNYNIASKFV